MALYNNPYQYSFGVPGQMNQFQQQPVQMPAQPVQQPQQNNNGILWVSGEVGAKSYLVAPGTSVLLMDSESEKFFIKSTDVSGMPQPLRTFEYHEVGTQMPPTKISRIHSTGTKKWSTTTLSLMRCAAATMTITANVEESATAWGDTAQMTAG